MSTEGPGGANWDDIYIGDGSDTEPFDHLLLAEALKLPPGQALDLGCGAGGNVIGLATAGLDGNRRGFGVQGHPLRPDQRLRRQRARAVSTGGYDQLAAGRPLRSGRQLLRSSAPGSRSQHPPGQRPESAGTGWAIDSGGVGRRSKRRAAIPTTSPPWAN